MQEAQAPSRESKRTNNNVSRSKQYSYEVSAKNAKRTQRVEAGFHPALESGGNIAKSPQTCPFVKFSYNLRPLPAGTACCHAELDI